MRKWRILAMRIPLAFLIVMQVSHVVFAEDLMTGIKSITKALEVESVKSQIEQGKINLSDLIPLFKTTPTSSSCKKDAKEEGAAPVEVGEHSLVAILEISNPSKVTPQVEKNPYIDVYFHANTKSMKGALNYLTSKTFSSQNLTFQNFKTNLKTLREQLVDPQHTGDPKKQGVYFIDPDDDVTFDATEQVTKEQKDTLLNEGAFLALLNSTVANLNNTQNNEKINDSKIFQEITDLIRDNYTSKEDQVRVLSLYADKLYDGYNEARNPFSNNITNNPDRLPLPQGSISMIQLAQAAQTYDRNGDGGVCNDIAAAIGQIAQRMFPGDEVFTIHEMGNSRSHFGTLLSDGKSTRVITDRSTVAYDQTKNGLQLNLGHHDSMNVRIQKINSKGQLNEVFLAKNPYGVFIEKLTDPNNPYYIQNGRNFSSQILQFNKIISEKNEMSTGLGVAEMNDGSTVVAVFAKVDSKTKNSIFINQFSSALGTQVQPGSQDVMIHINDGFYVSGVIYQNPRVKIEGKVGAKVELAAGVAHGQQKVGFLVDGNAGLNASLNTRFMSRSQKTSFELGGDFSTQMGSRSYNDMLGNSAKKAIQYLKLYPNQMLVKVQVQQSLTPKSKMYVGGAYQGTALGQNIVEKVGFNIQAKSGVQVETYIGALQKLKGWESKNNYLSENTAGLEAGANVKIKKPTMKSEVKIGLEAQGLTSKQPQVQFTTVLPIQKIKKKNK